MFPSLSNPAHFHETVSQNHREST